jgi:hypothetical protein
VSKLSDAIDAFAARLPRRDGSGSRQALSPAVRFLRGARLAHTAEELEGSRWSRSRERSSVGACRAALWRHVLFVSAIEQMHRAVFTSAFPRDIPEPWRDLDGSGVLVALPREPVTDRHGNKRAQAGAEHDVPPALRRWLRGGAVAGHWAALRLGVSVRHAVAHGALSPTQAKQWGVEPNLPVLFADHTAWVIALLAWGPEHFFDAPREYSNVTLTPHVNQEIRP